MGREEKEDEERERERQDQDPFLRKKEEEKIDLIRGLLLTFWGIQR